MSYRYILIKWWVENGHVTRHLYHINIKNKDVKCHSLISWFRCKYSIKTCEKISYLKSKLTVPQKAIVALDGLKAHVVGMDFNTRILTREQMLPKIIPHYDYHYLDIIKHMLLKSGVNWTRPWNKPCLINYRITEVKRNFKGRRNKTCKQWSIQLRNAKKQVW